MKLKQDIKCMQEVKLSEELGYLGSGVLCNPVNDCFILQIFLIFF